MTRDELTNEALKEIQNERECTFKAEVKHAVRAIMGKQAVIVTRQRELKELQKAFKELDVEPFDENVFSKT